MDIKQLRYFVTIVNTKSFSAAGKFLYVSQSTLSKSMKALEEELKVPLLYFSGKKMYTTSYGSELYNLAQNLLIQYDTISSTISGIKHLQKGLLRIGLPPIIGTCVFPELISGFIQKYPGIELVISQKKATVIQQMVSNSLLDFGFTLQPISDSVNQFPIIQSKYEVVAHKSNPILKNPVISYTDLKNERFILLDEPFKFYNIIMANCQNANFVPNILMRLQDWDLILRLIQQISKKLVLKLLLVMHIREESARTILHKKRYIVLLRQIDQLCRRPAVLQRPVRRGKAQCVIHLNKLRLLIPDIIRLKKTDIDNEKRRHKTDHQSEKNSHHLTLD